MWFGRGNKAVRRKWPCFLSVLFLSELPTGWLGGIPPSLSTHTFTNKELILPVGSWSTHSQQRYSWSSRIHACHSPSFSQRLQLPANDKSIANGDARVGNRDESGTVLVIPTVSPSALVTVPSPETPLLLLSLCFESLVLTNPGYTLFFQLPLYLVGRLHPFMC